MARQRALHPGFFTDGELLSLPPLARLLYAGLWGIADREGRLKDRPADIKAQVLPGDACDINQLLGALSGVGRIVRYEANGGRYIHIPRFLDYQRPHHREANSAIPPPPSPNLGTAQPQPRHGSAPTLARLSPNLGTAQPQPSPEKAAGDGDGDGDGDGEEAFPADAGRPVLRLEVEPDEKPRKLSPQESFWEWAQRQRRELTDLPDQAWSIRDKNTRLKPLLAFDAGDITDAYLAFLEDQHWATADPPWPMGAFVGQRSEYLSKARRADA